MKKKWKKWWRVKCDIKKESRIIGVWDWVARFFKSVHFSQSSTYFSCWRKSSRFLARAYLNYFATINAPAVNISYTCRDPALASGARFRGFAPFMWAHSSCAFMQRLYRRAAPRRILPSKLPPDLRRICILRASAYECAHASWVYFATELIIFCTDQKSYSTDERKCLYLTSKS